jgi:pimeloyl-ACP methyl ester carboxylesterase
MSASPFLLVHGAWHLLGPEVGLGTHADDIVELILAEDLTEVVLVGHSYAGLVITAVADRVPERIAQLVYLDAMVPVDGENAGDVMPITQVLIDLAAKTAEPWRIPPLPELPPPGGLFGVSDPGDVAWLRTMLGDHPLRCLTEPVRLTNPAATAIPRTHIHCEGSKPEGFERRPVPAVQPNGTPAQVWELTAGHDCMITVPGELAGLLLKVG